MRSLKVVGSSFTGLLLAFAMATAGCSRETPSAEGAFANDLKGAAPQRPVAPVARGGIADDGIKPVAPVAKGGVADDGVKPVAPVARGGIADDGIKPVPGAVAKVGTNDDSVKPAPVPVTKGGIPDDSIKPRTLPAPLPKPAPR